MRARCEGNALRIIPSLHSDEGGTCWFCDHREQHLCKSRFGSSATKSSRRFRLPLQRTYWQLGTVTAPLHEVRTRPHEVKNRFVSASGALL